MASPKKEKPAQAESPKKAPRSLWLSLFILILGIISGSYLTTGTYDFGGQTAVLRKLYMKLAPWAERQFTPAQLAEFDGTDLEKPIYLAIKGRVYDVSAGPSYYGKGGSYHFFSGKDASRAYITGCFKDDLTHDLRGLTDEEIKSMKTWIDFYENSNKYHYVGKVIHDPIPEDAPLHPKCRK